MLKIKIPENNINERLYIIHIIMKCFLNLEYIVEYGSKNYEIILSNGNTLIIEDHFFNIFKSDLEYLQAKAIPESIKFCKNRFLANEKNIPVIFGNDKCEVEDKQKKIILCGIDLFASSFFMLSRWEEYVNSSRDIHGRFPANESVAFRNNFLHRAVVDEYVAMLQNMLVFLDENFKFNKKKSEVFITHDVDEIYFWKNFFHVARVAAGDILKRKNFILAFSRFTEYLSILTNKIKDPYDTFDFLMDLSETAGLKSRFYFLCGGVTIYDRRYKLEEAEKIIGKIVERGHVVGFHASYNSYNNSDLFGKEKKLLENKVSKKIKEGRQHYLRFEIPVTWQIWEDNGMLIDSSCCYAQKEGFRCGTGNEFNVFNILTRQKLKLKERPLIVMDRNLFGYQNLNYEEGIRLMNELLNRSKTFTLLWHNSSIDNFDFYKNFIEKLL